MRQEGRHVTQTLSPTGTGCGEPEKNEFPALLPRPPSLQPCKSSLAVHRCPLHPSLHLADHSQPPLHVTTQWMPHCVCSAESCKRSPTFNMSFTSASWKEPAKIILFCE